MQLIIMLRVASKGYPIDKGVDNKPFLKKSKFNKYDNPPKRKYIWLIKEVFDDDSFIRKFPKAEKMAAIGINNSIFKKY